MTAPASDTRRWPVTERDVISCDPDVVGGIPVFKGTRVPAAALFTYLMDGGSLDEFLDEFPTAPREYALTALESARDHVSQPIFPSRESATRDE